MGESGKKKVVRTYCALEDGIMCGIRAHVEDGVLTKLEPGDFPEDPELEHICARGMCMVKLVNHEDRLKHPMKRVGERGEGKWEKISWEEAFDTIAAKFKETAEKYGEESVSIGTGGYVSSVLSMIFLKLTNAIQGTYLNLGGYGDAAGPCGDTTSFGSIFAHRYFQDIDDPGMYVLWGANYAETYPLRWRRIRDAKEKGVKLIVIDPLFTTSAAKADQHISIRPGTDTALALGMIKVVLDKGLEDRDFMIKYTVGPYLVRSDDGKFLRDAGHSEKYMVWDSITDSPRLADEEGVVPSLEGTYTINGVECRPSYQLLVDMTAEYTLEKTTEITEIPEEIIEKLALEYVEKKPVASCRGWGLQRTFHGDITHRAITALAAITGNLRNVSYPNIVLNRRDFVGVKGRQCRFMPIMNLYDAAIKGDPYQVKSLWMTQHNMVNQDSNFNKLVNEVIPSLDFFVVSELFMTTTAKYADIVLPASSFYECLGLSTTYELSVYPYLQLMQKVVEPMHDSKPDFEIACEVGKRMGFSEDFDMTAEQAIELLLSADHPSVKDVTIEKLRQGPVKAPMKDEGENWKFRTPSGKIELYAENLQAFGEELPVYKEPLESTRRPEAKKYPLNYFSTHTRYRKHSMFANVDWLKELDPEPVLEMNTADAKERGINGGDIVTIRNDRGKVRIKAKVHEGVRPGIVNIKQGWWEKDYIEGHHQMLTNSELNPSQCAVHEPNMAMLDNLVEVSREGGDE
ncbi:MAG: molybdopterin-dependent oxidoreductase [Desulfobacterales bacterium]|jgi:anaerobic dimethyl sulfoxide reductase subunit A|nr:molybdopterin-dependent oxidoreductase [Desulfobacteraceae bacterium]MBT7086902.1 molybdopterin-dependent oxidoreductase [Desulfobacterales bacterium]MBT7697036.1 molybdopterin-dependent oxidoreductase [Desulfobacterales bacterium]